MIHVHLIGIQATIALYFNAILDTYTDTHVLASMHTLFSSLCQYTLSWIIFMLLGTITEVKRHSKWKFYYN